jgi:hypothetical protein
VAQYELPDLPYDYGALEPAITGEIMELHHDKHHAAAGLRRLGARVLPAVPQRPPGLRAAAVVAGQLV